MIAPLSISQPVVWTVLGYPFEAASMLAALSACLVVRIWIYLKDLPNTMQARAVDAAVTVIALLFSAGWVALQRPAPFFALLSGCGFGALGSGIIAISLRWMQRIDPTGCADDPKIKLEPEQNDPFRKVDVARTRARRADRTHHGRKK